MHGYISLVRKAFDTLKVSQPHIDHFPPESILPYYGRKMWTSTIGDIRKNFCQKVFIKPLKKQKLFNGHLLQGNFYSLVKTANLDDEE